MHQEAAKIVQNEGAPPFEDLHTLLLQPGVAEPGVEQGGPRSAREGEKCGERVTPDDRCAIRRNGLRLDADQRLADQVEQKIQEVTAFADDPPSADCGIVNPVIGRQETGVDAVNRQRRAGEAVEDFAGAARQRTVTPVEADGEQAPRAAGRGEERPQLTLLQAERSLF